MPDQLHVPAMYFSKIAYPETMRQHAEEAKEFQQLLRLEQVHRMNHEWGDQMSPSGSQGADNPRHG